MLRLITPPAALPVLLDDVALEARVTAPADYSRLERYVRPAVADIERLTNRALINQTWELVLPGFLSVIELPKAPLSSVTSITYYDTAGVSRTLAVSAYQLSKPVGDDAQPATIRPAVDTTWPSTQAREDAVVIRFVAGYGDAPVSVPQSLRVAVSVRAAQFNEGRLDDGLVMTLVAPYRVFTW